jgi:formylglycine-generating enzyme
MRSRFIAALASAAGVVSLVQGVVLVKLTAMPVGIRGLVTLGNVGAVLALPRNALAATAGVPFTSEIPGRPGSNEESAQLTQLSPLAAPADLAATPKLANACPSEMVLVEGDYCPEVVHQCAKWMEDKGRYAFYRCAEYASAKCLSKERVHKRFCMDRDEYAKPGDSLPASNVAWRDADQVCGAQGKRVCKESEWNFACEGEEMRPYPYGWKRDAEACNADRTDIYRADGELRDLRVGADGAPRCVSPFGVHNLTGNLEEWTTIDGSDRSGPARPAMKGAYWQPSRNHCRAAQTAHDRFYHGTETGFRCCSDTPE